MDPTIALTTAIDNAAKVSSTPLFATIVDRVMGFRISKWSAEGEIRKKEIHEQYEKAKESGLLGVQYIKSLRETTNLIDLAVKSSQYIDPNKSNEIEIDNDFFWNTLEYAKTISNETMQELISKIIAGEYNNTGSYSMSTLHTLKMLGKDELELLTRIGSLLVDGSEIPNTLFSLPEDAKEFLNDLRIDFGSLQSLQSLGIFLPNEMTNSRSNNNKRNFVVSYFDQKLIFEPTHDTIFTIERPGFYGLSTAGKQIMQNLTPQFNEKYFNWLKKNYIISNYKILGENL